MLNLLRNLVRDCRGNALVLSAAAMPCVIGAAGLATDSIHWAVWKRELQRTADSAALAAVYASAQSATVSTAVDSDIAKNNHTGVAIKSGYPIISYPTVTGYSTVIKVDLAVQKTLGFSSLFLSVAPTIVTSATAAYVNDNNFCAGALKTSGGPGITIGGSSSVNLGCKAISNANVNPSVATNGASYSFTAPLVAAVGSLPSEITGVTTLDPYHVAMPDPYAGKYSTTPTSNCNKQINGSATNLTPGCYKDFAFSGNKTYTLAPGTYFLDSTDFSVAGGTTIIGTGVTIILTGTTPGSIKTNGNSTIQLSAPTSGAYANMLFIQSPSATTDNSNIINGSDTSSFDGAIYIPNGNVTFSGSSGAITKCVSVMAYTLSFSGNTNLQNNTTGCTAATTFSNKLMKLIA